MYLCAYVPMYLFTCLPVSLSGNVEVRLWAYVHTCLCAYVPTCLPVSLSGNVEV